MKKVLYGTTALVSAGVVAAAPANAAEKISLSLGGYYNSFFAVGEVNGAASTDYLNSTVFSEGEVHFKGKTELDNGLEVGFQAQLEINNGNTNDGPQDRPDDTGANDIIDEAFLYVEGGFGRFIIGSENSAAYLMQTSAPSVGVPINSGWVTVFIPPAPGSTDSFRAPAVSTFGDFGNDDNKLTYFTPRISGFQLGVSYAPSVAGVGGESNGLQVDGDPDFVGEDGISVGANYVGDFAGTNITISGGYRTIDRNDGTDWSQYSGGIKVGFGNFTVGGAVLNEDSDIASDGIAYDVGVSYGHGPWTFGVQALLSEVEGNTLDASEDELTAVKGAVAYSLAPGVTASASLLYAEWEVEDTENAAAGGDGDQDGVVGIFGIAVGF